MILMPRNTTILQARDAMLAADVARFGGANQDLLWRALPSEASASSRRVTSATGDTDPVPDFSLPQASNATLDVQRGLAKDGDPLPVNANPLRGRLSRPASTPIA